MDYSCKFWPTQKIRDLLEHQDKTLVYLNHIKKKGSIQAYLDHELLTTRLTILH